jgi:ABC-type polysaccharide/polyol phosphate export permease
MRVLKSWPGLAEFGRKLTPLPARQNVRASPSGKLGRTARRFTEAWKGVLGLPGAPHAWLRGINLWIDRAIVFCMLERSIILRTMRISGQGSMAVTFRVMVRVLLVINVHIWGFWYIGRRLPGSTSYVTYCVGGFMPYFFFGAVAMSIRPSRTVAVYDKNLNIKWIHLVIASSAVECLMITIGSTITILFYALLDNPDLGRPVAIPNMGLLVLASTLAMTLGLGFGLIMRTAQRRWPIIEVTWESGRWIIFITSGLYTSYAMMPWYVAKYVWYSPLVAPLEYCRAAFDSAYSVGDLSLAYSASVALCLVFVGLGFRRWELSWEQNAGLA